jgi:alpha-tubulin suppressor-like RCC1 family protein
MTRVVLTIASTLLLNAASCGRTSLASDLDSYSVNGTASSPNGTGTESATGGQGTAVTTTSSVGGALLTGGTTSSGMGGRIGSTQGPKNPARFIATGMAHACAVLSDGSITCWGMNDRGQLGDGTTTDRNTPTKVLDLSGATTVAAAFDHTCATLGGGEVKCWGSNSQGQLGDGTSIDSALPITVPGLTRAVGVDVGGWPGHSCASTLDGTVYCWGNAFSDPNDVNNAQWASPMLISGLTQSNVAAVSLGGEHSCALAAAGAVYCWGANNYGQLGNGSTTTGSTPALVRSSDGAIAIAAGGNTACAIMATEGVQCWGSNSDGQLGNYELTSSGFIASTTPVPVYGLTSPLQISVGSASACAVINGGMVQCWGRNSAGELGDGTTLSRSQPVTVTSISSATNVATGGHFTCTIFGAGNVSCWGSNLLGQLGNGTNVDSLVPVAVAGF